MGFGKLKANSGGGEFTELVPAGNHPAMLIGIIDLGTHTEQYQNNKPHDAHKVMLAWELPTEQKSDSTINHVIAATYTYSFHKKSALRLMIENWRGSAYKEGDEFDISVMLGKQCLLSVIHAKNNDGSKTYANVSKSGASAIPKGMKCPPAQNKPICWAIGDGPVPEDPWLPRSFGEKIGDVIARSKELQGQPVLPSSEELEAAGISESNRGDEFQDRF